jgi:hypothetical protein
MGSLLSAISGQFAKAIVLGTMFPVLIVSAMNVLLVAPLSPHTEAVPAYLAKIALGDEKWPAVVLSFVVFVLTGLLYDLNIPIIRMYEGYPWQKSFIGRSFLRLQRRRFDEALRLESSDRSLQAQMIAAQEKGSILADLQGQKMALDLFLSSQLPDAEALLLPTRLGNVIRCFERYPFLAYGMDAIVLWPRLVSKIDSAFASTIDEAKTTFDFMLNMSFLSGVTALGVLGIGLGARAPLEFSFIWPWLWRASLFAVLALLFYSFSINRALAWGEQVRSAFDLYRLDLLKGLGYQQKPLTYQEERALWTKISSQIQFADSRVIPLPYDQPLTRVIPYPSDISLVVQHECGPQQGNLRIPVSVEVKNADTVRPVSSLTVIATIPDGYKYVPDSATVSSGGIVVRQFAPLELYLGSIQPGAKMTVSYLMKQSSS